MRKYNKFVNEWPWGTAVTFISKDGLSMIHVRFEDDLPFGYISNIVTHPTARQEGRANEMLPLAEDEIRQRGLDAAVLGVANKGWIYDWYIQHGYVDTGETTPGGDYMKLMKQL